MRYEVGSCESEHKYRKIKGRGGSFCAQAPGSNSPLCWGAGWTLRPAPAREQTETVSLGTPVSKLKTEAPGMHGGGWWLAVLETQRTETCQPWK